MAIYHFSAQVASRSVGKSAVAMAAYRSGEKLKDERTGETKHYRHRTVTPDTMILAPDHAPKWVYDRNRLWNEVEKIEKQKNAQLCREITVALPKEFTESEQNRAIELFCKKTFVDRGMVADIAIHRDDKNNPHAHIMLTMRPFNEDGTWGSKAKKEYVLDENGGRIRLPSGEFKSTKVSTTDWDKKETLESWREAWSKHINQIFEKAKRPERIDHRSLEAQGKEELPTVHEGYVVRKMEKRGIQTDRGDINRAVKAHNVLVIDFQRYREVKLELEKKIGSRGNSEPQRRSLAERVKEIKLQEMAKQFGDQAKEYNQLQEKVDKLFDLKKDVRRLIENQEKVINVLKERDALESERYSYLKELEELKPKNIFGRIFNKNKNRIKELEQTIEQIDRFVAKCPKGEVRDYQPVLEDLNKKLETIAVAIDRNQQKQKEIRKQTEALQVREKVIKKKRLER